MPEALLNTLQEEDPTEWTKSKIREHIATGGKFNSGRINYLLKNNFTSTSTIETLTLISPTINPTLLTIPPTNPVLPTILPTATLQPTPTPPLQRESNYIDLTLQPEPPRGQSQSQGFGKELTNLAKMYTEDNKYSGEDDNFDFKLTIFYDLCSRADVPQEAKVKAYPIMLRGLALDHYYTNLKNVTLTLSFD